MEKSKDINIIYMTHFKETIKYRFIILDWLVHLRVFKVTVVLNFKVLKKYFLKDAESSINILCIPPPSPREDWDDTWNLEKQTKIWYTQLCRRWHMFFIFYTETHEINNYARFIFKSFIVRNLFNQKLLP